MNKKTIIANWKMNSSFDQAQAWTHKLTKKITAAIAAKHSLPEIILCPPSIMIDYIDGLLMENEFAQIEKIHHDIEAIEEKELEKLIAQTRVIKLGGQDCYTEEQGAFTGDISARMLKDAGAWYVIVGHSERRTHHLESDDIIAKKITRAVAENLIPILCVGEAKTLRDSNIYAEFITNQLINSLPKNLEINNLIIAYEPIWSIGTGLTPTIAQIEEIAALIKTTVSKNHHIKNFKIIYGGSIKKDNAAEILVAKNIDGLLVGGASLDVEEFFKIINSGA